MSVCVGGQVGAAPDQPGPQAGAAAAVVRARGQLRAGPRAHRPLRLRVPRRRRRLRLLRLQVRERLHRHRSCQWYNRHIITFMSEY